MFNKKALLLSLLLVPTVTLSKNTFGSIEDNFKDGVAVVACAAPIATFMICVVVAGRLIDHYFNKAEMRTIKKALKIKLKDQVADLKDQVHCLHHELENVADKLENHIYYAEQA